MSEYRCTIEEIRRFLPHRAPFLLVDRVLEVHPVGDLKDVTANDKVGIKVVAMKNYTYNEPFMQGHFPEFSIVPGVILIESMAQSASFSLYPYIKDRLGKTAGSPFSVALIGIDGTRFRKPVVPGDTVRMESVVTKKRGLLWMFESKAYVDGQLAVETELMASVTLN